MQELADDTRDLGRLAGRVRHLFARGFARLLVLGRAVINDRGAVFGLYAYGGDPVGVA
jgi:hypothetical protein